MALPVAGHGKQAPEFGQPDLVVMGLVEFGQLVKFSLGPLQATRGSLRDPNAAGRDRRGIKKPQHGRVE